MTRQVELTATVKFALAHVAKFTDDLFSEKAEKLLRKYKVGTKRILTKDVRDRVEHFKEFLPEGIYTNVSEVLRVIEETIQQNKVTSISHSPLAVSYPEFKCCKIMKYQKGHIITGRDVEIEQILLTLCKSTKRGVILVGEPGVGKTAIVNAINARLIERIVPRHLIGAQIFNVDIPYIFTKYKEDPIGTIIKILERASTYDKAILFIDEVHQLLGHKMNDIMKPYLTEQIRFIGSTTVNEYHSIITEDVALERRFTLIPVEEPSISKTISMIEGTKSFMERMHKCTIPTDVCEYVVKNGSRFLGHRKNPDKSLDLLDIACAIMDDHEVKTESTTFKEVVDDNEVKSFLQNLTKNKTEIESMKVTPGDRVLNKHYINLAIANVTNIPFDEIQNSLEYKAVLSKIQEKVFGQDEALKSLANVVNIFKHTKAERERPLSVILCVGPAGCGKRTAAKLLAKNLFGDENRYIEFDMSGMTSEFMITELKGAPPGYVGYGKSGGLIKSLRNNPQSVVFFRGTNKANETIIQYLIECSRHGKITDSAEREASLVNTVIIHSITLKDDDYKKLYAGKASMGFSTTPEDKENKGYSEKALKDIVGEELLRSVDEVILFNKLSEQDLKKIFEVNTPQYLDIYDVDIDRSVLETNVLSGSKNGHDVVSRLASEIPKMVFSKLKE